MTSLYYGIDIPYEVQLEHDAAISPDRMVILESQRSPERGAARHYLTPGVYMVSLTYNGAQRATLHHFGGETAINSVSVPEGTAGAPRTSAPMKISVQGTDEYLQVVAVSSTGGSARATISVIPASTFDEMEESAKGASVLSEISDLKTTKADKSEVAVITTRLDTKANKVDVQNDLGDMAGLLAEWTADAVGGRNHFSYTHLSNLENWHSGTYFVLKEVIQLEPNAEYTFHVEEITADAEDEWTVLNLMDGTDGVPPWNASAPNRMRTIYNRKYEGEPRYGLSVTFTAPSSGKVYFEFYPSGKFGEATKPFWVTEKLVRAQIVRGREVPEWRPSPEDAVQGYQPNGESTSPLLPFDPATAIRVDNSVGTRIFAGDTMIHGDTGRRSVPEFSTSLDVSTSTAHGIHIRRVGDLVTLTASGKWISGTWITELIPSGFRPISSDYRSARGIASIGGNLYTFGNGATLHRFSFSGVTIDPGTSVSLESTWYTTDSWPTTLPGLPA